MRASFVAVCALLAVGCSVGSAGQAECEPAQDIDDPVVMTPDGGVMHEDEHHDARWACEFDPQAMPATTVSGDLAGLRSNIKHVFVLMLENRSFDHFLSDLPAVGIHDADVATDAHDNPGPDGTPVERYETDHLCLKDVPHEWLAAHQQYDGGLNDGFVATGGRRSMSFYRQDKLPFHYFLAQKFAISDRYFASMMGPTWPNRLFFWNGTSCGFAEDFTTNPFVIPNCGLSAPSLFTMLGDRVDIYDDSGPLAVGTLLGVYRSAPKSIAAFKEAVALETETTSALPEVVMLGATDKSVPLLGKVQNDDHADVNVQLGQKFMFDIVSTITAKEELWRSSVLFITWDEYGGFYDHVPPPKACHPEPDAPRDAPKFDRLGFRVPLYVVSPFVRRGYVSSYVAEHASILRFIEAWLDQPALTKRDANAWAMLDFFNFAEPDYSVPELDPALAEPSPTGLSECQANPEGFDE